MEQGAHSVGSATAALVTAGSRSEPRASCAAQR